MTMCVPVDSPARFTREVTTTWIAFTIWVAIPFRTLRFCWLRTTWPIPGSAILAFARALTVCPATVAELERCPLGLCRGCRQHRSEDHDETPRDGPATDVEAAVHLFPPLEAS